MDDLYIVVPSWERFQHYKDRDPKWIKVYNSLLSDDSYLDLTPHCRALLHGLWLVYATSNRRVKFNTSSLSRRLQMRVTSGDLKKLTDAGFITQSKTYDRSENDWASRYVSDATRAVVLERDGHKCRNCGETETLEIDHVTPISRGGDSSIDNLQTLCRPCNRTKHNLESVTDLSSISPRSVTPEKNRKDLEKKTKPPDQETPPITPPTGLEDSYELETLEQLAARLAAQAAPLGSEGRLLEVLPDMDANSPAVIHALLEKLPARTIEEVREEILHNQPRSPVKYAVGMLQKRVEQRASRAASA